MTAPPLPVAHRSDLDAAAAATGAGQWYVDNVRYALDILAELHALELKPVPQVESRSSGHGAAHRHLVASLRAGARRESARDLERYGVTAASGSPADASQPASELQPASRGTAVEFGGWRQRCAYRLARHLARVDEIGPAVSTVNATEAGELLSVPASRAVADPESIERRLCEFIRDAGPEHDRDLIVLFDRQFQRLHQTLGPADSLIVRHPPLQPLPRSA